MQTEPIFGIRAVIEAISAGKEIEKVLIKNGSQGELITELLQHIHKHKVSFQYVPLERLSKYSKGNHQGVIALVSPIIYQDIEQVINKVLKSGKDPLVLVIDHVTDVRNFGAMARTAECTGVDAILVAEKGAAQVNSDAIKTSAGALLSIPVCRAKSMMKAVTFLKQSGLQIVAATEKAESSIYQADLTGPMALVLGSEDRGISPDMLKLTDLEVRIPLLGEIASLNVSVAAGVILYEAQRQKTV
ncbi:MAG: rRNA ((2251)-2-O)-methyltransferase RlmB [Bacteroidota bacterium]|jgi:23S rRNA (guanosine2251-2'-O)-methyltransferase